MGAGEEVKGFGAFARLGLSALACRAVAKGGFRLPTPIQRKTIPLILKNEGDVLACARTGSGKTAAFLLPILDRLREHSPIVGARALIVAPTRELALQIGMVAKSTILAVSNLRLCNLIGGMSMEKQFDYLAANPDIIIATPGRLVHHLRETNYELKRVCTAVFDEADQLFELGFEEDLNVIMSSLKLATKQCILTSATMPSSVVAFAKQKFVSPTFIELNIDKQLPEQLELQFFYIRETDRIPALLFWLRNIFRDFQQTIIFCATSHHVTFVGEFLVKAGFPNVQLSGSATQQQREESMKAFRLRQVNILVATDVAARGVDIPSLDYVIHMDYPTSAKLFIHRSGRTARRNEGGTAISLITKDDLPYVVELLLFLGRRIKVEPSTVIGEEKKEGVAYITSDITSESKKHLELGGIPNCDEEREFYSQSLAEDADIQRLHKAMIAASSEYLRHRPSASKMSKKRAGDILNEAGGPSVVASSIHTALRSAVPTAESVLNLETGLSEVFKSEKEEPKIKHENATIVVHDLIDLNTVTEFRPSSKGKGLGVSDKTFEDVAAARAAREQVRHLAAATLHPGETSELEAPSQAESSFAPQVSQRAGGSGLARKPRRSGGGSRRMEEMRKLEQLGIPLQTEQVIAREESLKLNNKSVFEGDSKYKTVRKWNPRTKKYELVEIDRSGKRTKTNAAGVKVKGLVEKTGLYKRWSKRADKKIQRVGENEDTRYVEAMTRRINVSTSPEDLEGTVKLESLTKDLGLIEKVNKKLQLTHKEQRKLARLKKVASNPISKGTNEIPGTKTFSEIKKREVQIRKRAAREEKRQEANKRRRKK